MRLENSLNPTQEKPVLIHQVGSQLKHNLHHAPDTTSLAGYSLRVGMTGFRVPLWSIIMIRNRILLSGWSVGEEEKKRKEKIFLFYWNDFSKVSESLGRIFRQFLIFFISKLTPFVEFCFKYFSSRFRIILLNNKIYKKYLNKKILLLDVSRLLVIEYWVEHHQHYDVFITKDWDAMLEHWQVEI